jgi:TfoX/Sxy family transcriptional regulator of competence genes
MAYSEKLEKEIDQVISGWGIKDKRKMFGGICYLTGGNMAFGIWKDSLIVRCGPELGPDMLKAPDTRPFDVTGRAMKGWVMVAEKNWGKPGSLEKWLQAGLDFARSLPVK